MIYLKNRRKEFPAEKNDLVYHQGQIIKNLKLDIQLLQHRYTCGRMKFDLVGLLEFFILKLLVCSSENLDRRAKLETLY